VLAHRVISEDAEQKVVYVEQAASVGFLWFRRHFVTALQVTHYHKKLTTCFQLARPGMMANFQVWCSSVVRATELASLTYQTFCCEL
jgi:hypothetical protein